MNLLSLIPGFSFFRLGIAAVILVTVSAFVWKWHHGRVVEAVAVERAVWVDDLNKRMAAQLAQEQANRAKESELNATIVKQRASHAKDLERRNHTALLVAGQLREFQAITSQPRPAGQDSTSARIFDDARTTVINECSGAVAAMDGDTQRLRDKVTGLQSYVTDVCLK